jgi:hypothetical protein
MPARLRSVILLSAALALPAAAQERKHVAYPERNALSPFREPADVYAPPDEVFRLLRIMQTLAEAPGAAKSYDQDGRETIDDPRWRSARGDLLRQKLDAGYLAGIMRNHKNAADRATAFYGMFYVANVDHVFELIAHIPGEPVRSTREAALPRAIEFVRKNLRRRFGDLSREQQEELVKALPEPGSPVARASGLNRRPLPGDPLHTLALVPFFQLLDLDEPLDQAQGAWFLKETFAVRGDLALQWLEPALPRLRQLLLSPSLQVREQVVGLFQTIGPEQHREPPLDDPRALVEWADEAAKAMFPPIRNLNDAILQLHPSPERDALAKAAVDALTTSSIGDPYVGQRADGTWLRGFRVARVPDELKPLAIPARAVITHVNGIAVRDAATLLAAVRGQLAGRAWPRTVVIEYVLDDKNHAVEYRVL